MSTDAASVSTIEAVPSEPVQEPNPVSTAVTPAVKKKAPKKGVRTEAKPAASGSKKGATRVATPPAAKLSAKAPAGVNREFEPVAASFKTLGCAPRVAIIAHLAENGPTHVGALALVVRQSQPAVSHHLALLRHAGVVVSDREGKNIGYSLTSKGKDLAKIAGKHAETLANAAAK